MPPEKKGVAISSLFAPPNLPVGIDMIESIEKWPNCDRREEPREAEGATGGRGPGTAESEQRPEAPACSLSRCADSVATDSSAPFWVSGGSSSPGRLPSAYLLMCSHWGFRLILSKAEGNRSPFADGNFVTETVTGPPLLWARPALEIFILFALKKNLSIEYKCSVST